MIYDTRLQPNKNGLKKIKIQIEMKSLFFLHVV